MFISRVEINGQPTTARQLAAGATSANTALTASTDRITMRAVTADIRYAVGSSAQTATATSHFIAAGERLTILVPSGANIAVIQAGASAGTLEVTEFQ
jgi:hypothetical protein